MGCALKFTCELCSQFFCSCRKDWSRSISTGFSEATKQRSFPLRTERLQLTLIAEICPPAHALPQEVRARSVELMARMLLQLVRGNQRPVVRPEVRDESR